MVTSGMHDGVSALGGVERGDIRATASVPAHLERLILRQVRLLGLPGQVAARQQQRQRARARRQGGSAERRYARRFMLIIFPADRETMHSREI